MTKFTTDLVQSKVTRRGFAGGAAAVAGAMALGRNVSFAAPAGKADLRKYGFQEGGNVIIIGTLGEAASINPFQTSESEGDWRCKMIFDEFVRMDPATYAPTPGDGLAKEWTIDGLTFTFTLNAANFSDGTPVTAADVEFTLLGHLAASTASPRSDKFITIAGAAEYLAGTAEGVSGIEVVDDMTIKITLASNDASFLLNLRYLFVAPKAALEGKSLVDDAWFQAPIGAGPFLFESWSTGADFVATKNPGYMHAGKPALDGFIHRVIADSNSLVLALQSNEIEGSIYPSPLLRSEIDKNADLVVEVPPFNSPNGWMMNLSNEWLAKKEVRQAIAMAINAEQYAADSLLGLGKAGLGPIAPDSWAFDPELKALPYDPAAAKAMLESVGATGIQLRAMVNQGNILREDWLTFSQQALQEVGIELIPEVIEYATLVDRVTSTQDFDLCGVDFVGVTADPGELAGQFMTGAAGNYMKYSNPELDALLEAARQELDIEVAKGLYKQIQAIIVDDAPMYFAWYRPFMHVINKKYTNYTKSNLEGGLFRALENITLA